MNILKTCLRIGVPRNYKVRKIRFCFEQGSKTYYEVSDPDGLKVLVRAGRKANSRTGWYDDRIKFCKCGRIILYRADHKMVLDSELSPLSGWISRMKEEDEKNGGLNLCD